MKVSLPSTSKFLCTLYRSSTSSNHEILFDHLSKTIDTITLQSPRSKITILRDFNVHNPNWHNHSPHISSPSGRDTETFAFANNMSQLISEPTNIPDHSGDKANTLDLFLTLVISPVLFSLFIKDMLPSTASGIFSFAEYTYLSLSFSSNQQHLAFSNISP